MPDLRSLGKYYAGTSSVSRIYYRGRRIWPASYLSAGADSPVDFSIIPPAPLNDLPDVGCRIPISQLEPITSSEANSRADISGCFVMGRLQAPPGQVGTDFIVQASGRTEFVYRRQGTSQQRSSLSGIPNYNYATFTGMQSDIDGEGIKLWDVNRLVDDPIHIANSRLEWANDLYGLVPGAKVMRCRLAGHTLYVNDKGEEQHPDGMQANWVPGRIEIMGCWIDGAILPVPRRSNGTPVAVATAVAPTASAVRFNDRAGLSNGPGIVTNNTMSGGDAFLLSVLPDYNGESWRNKWWMPTFNPDGTPLSGIHMNGNRGVLPRSSHADYQGPEDFYRVMKGQNVRVLADGTEVEFTARALINGFRN